MSQPLSLNQPVDVSDPADLLLEACLPPAHDHRAGGLERVTTLLRRDPKAARAHIWVASAVGDTAAVREWLRRDPALANRRGGTRHWEPLLYLCFSRLLRDTTGRAEPLIETARLLLAHGADPNCRWIDPAEAFGNRETPLYGAAGVANQVKLAQMLIEAGADPNDGETSYHMVEHDGVPCAEFIFPKLEPIHRGAALGHKLDYDDLPGLRKLLELGADPNGPTPFANMPLHQAVWRGRPRPFFELLAEFGADLNATNKHGKTAYALAARSGRGPIMQWLLEMGASPELSPIDDFFSACALGDERKARRLLERQPELVSHLDETDRAVVCEAAAAGDTEGVRLMLDLGWDVNTRGTVWKETPLHRAALEGRLETARMLMERGADLTVRDRSYSSSPLGWARHAGHAEVAELLASDPARLDLYDAAEAGHAGRVRQLLADIDPNAPLAGGDPGVLLRSAAALGRLEVVEALLEHGADPGLRNREGIAALDLARKNGHAAVVKLLEKQSS